MRRMGINILGLVNGMGRVFEVGGLFTAWFLMKHPDTRLTNLTDVLFVHFKAKMRLFLRLKKGLDKDSCCSENLALF